MTATGTSSSTDRLQRSGCEHYWVVDPDVPAVSAWRLVDGVYVEAGSVSHGDVLPLEAPFRVDVTLAALVE